MHAKEGMHHFPNCALNTLILCLETLLFNRQEKACMRGSLLKVEMALAIISLGCFVVSMFFVVCSGYVEFVSFCYVRYISKYFANGIHAFGMIGEPLGIQLLGLATSFFVGGLVVITMSVGIYAYERVLRNR